MITYYLLLLTSLKFCFSLTFTKSLITGGPFTTAPPPGIAVSDTCLVTIYDGTIPETFTLIPCPSDVSNIPNGCTYTRLKTLCPPMDHCAWINNPESSLICDTTDCFPWGASGAEPTYFCSGTWEAPTFGIPCVETIITSSVFTRYYTSYITHLECISTPTTNSNNVPTSKSITGTFATSTRTLSNGCLEISKQYFDVIEFSTTCPDSDPTPTLLTTSIPPECTNYEESVYCPDYCVTYIKYHGSDGFIGLGKGTICEPNGTSCDFITTEETPCFICTKQ